MEIKRKGAKGRKAVTKEALKNALLPSELVEMVANMKLTIQGVKK